MCVEMRIHGWCVSLFIVVHVEDNMPNSSKKRHCLFSGDHLVGVRAGSCWGISKSCVTVNGFCLPCNFNNW